MPFTYTVSFKGPYSNAKVQFEHVFMRLAMQLTYKELRYSSFYNSFLLIPFSADLLYKQMDRQYYERYGSSTVFLGITSPDSTGN
jgi:hypothetical protein